MNNNDLSPSLDIQTCYLILEIGTAVCNEIMSDTEKVERIKSLLGGADFNLGIRGHCDD